MSDIRIPASDGGAFTAYIAIPEITPAPAVIMIQEIFGVNQEMRDKCDELAAQGYIAICPDLFWRIEPGIQLVDSDEEQLQRAFDLFGQFDVDAGIEDLKTTLGYMRNHGKCNGHVAAIGYCLGGKLAYMMATRTDVDASIGYYGVAIETMLDEASQITKPLMLHIAEEDEFVPKDAQAVIKDALSAHARVILHSYAGVQHAFARGQGMHYDQQAATLANQRTADFLQSNLKAAQAA